MTHRERRRLLASAGGVAMLLASRPRAAAPVVAADVPFQFGFIGDTPYSRLEENALREVLAALSAQPLAFVLHAGDFKSRIEHCDDDLIVRRLALLDRCAHPLILTPGDNDWTDCSDAPAAWQPGGRLERLDRLRREAFGSPRSLGRNPMALEQQAPYEPPESRKPVLPENLRWRVGSLLFCTLHVVGSDNAPRNTPELSQAWSLRQQANGAWLQDTVQLARGQREQGLVKGLAIALHANMRFESDRADGWQQMRQLIIAAAVAFNGPVLLMHGDTHHFRADRLLMRSHGIANFHRVECFGSPFSSSWVQLRWDPSLARPGTDATANPFQVSIRSLS